MSTDSITPETASAIVGKPWWLRKGHDSERPPSELLDAEGLRELPEEFRDLVKCWECGADLTRSLHGFICSAGCLHSPLIPPATLLARTRVLHRRWRPDLSHPADRELLEPSVDTLFRLVIRLIEWRNRRPDLNRENDDSASNFQPYRSDPKTRNPQ